ncbi:MAG: T9SS type A sorting domain-containing protein [Bacteroidia bacterium]|nr:T9SS type A sorting domain-containing protein [Bacteroidia bacterium]
MKKKLFSILLLSFYFFATGAFAQCTGGTLQGTITPTTSWQTVATKSNHFYKFGATAGNVYYFSYCSCVGGSMSYYAELSIDSTAALAVNGEYGQVSYNSGYCGGTYNAPQVEWKCMKTGTYRILTTQQYCDTTSTLSATMAYKYITPSLCYSVSSVAYAPDAFTGTLIPMVSQDKDDGVSGYITLPFTFCFNGQSYTKIFAAANGYIVFKNGCDIIKQDTGVNGYTASPFTIQYLPFSNSTLTQVLSPGVMGPWLDIYPAPAGGGNMYYATYGVSPNRHFTVSWDAIEMFDCNAKLCTYQIQLYETSYNIEIQAKKVDTCHIWIPPGGQGAMGLLDETGYAALVPPGRNLQPWQTSSEAWKFTPSCCAVLPIQLESFTCSAANEGITLYWSSATETNNKLYTVTRSSDGLNFIPIGTVAGAGNSESERDYTYTDNQPIAGTNYYQLEQTDFDGNTTTLNTISCSTLFMPPGTLRPNPASDECSLSLNYSDEPQTVTISDGTGRTVFSRTYSNMKGSPVLLNISAYQQGVYIVSVTCPNMNPIVKRLVVK